MEELINQEDRTWNEQKLRTLFNEILASEILPIPLNENLKEDHLV